MQENKQKVLVIDDDLNIAELLRYNLENAGYETSVCYDGFDGFILAKEFKPDLIMLDWMMPGISGLDLLKKIRTDKDLQTVPIIMVTAKDTESDIVEGLDTGADDYIKKPFEISEVIARINSVLRRYSKTTTEEKSTLKAFDINMNLSTHEVFKGDNKLEFTLKEFELLKLLISNRGKVLSRNFLLDKVWGYEYFGETRTVDVHIRYIRKKIGDENEKYIETIRGVGYKLKAE